MIFSGTILNAADENSFSTKSQPKANAGRREEVVAIK
jgi:hypothetical protein